MNVFKSKITDIAIAIAEFLIEIRARKLNVLERMAFYMCVYAHTDLLMMLACIGIIGQWSAPHIISEHSLSENYVHPRTRKPRQYHMISAQIGVYDITLRLAWLSRHTELDMQSLRKWIQIAYPNSSLETSRVVMKVLPIEAGKKLLSRTVVYDLKDETWCIEGEMDPEPVMFDAFPLFTKQ